MANTPLLSLPIFIPNQYFSYVQQAINVEQPTPIRTKDSLESHFTLPFGFKIIRRTNNEWPIIRWKESH